MLFKETERRKESRCIPRVSFICTFLLVFRYFVEFNLLMFYWEFLYLCSGGILVFKVFLFLNFLWFLYHYNVKSHKNVFGNNPSCSLFLENVLNCYSLNVGRSHWWNCLGLEDFNCEFTFFSVEIIHIVCWFWRLKVWNGGHEQGHVPFEGFREESFVASSSFWWLSLVVGIL